MTRVKVCGITCLEDAQLAVQCGADAIGFIFAPSPRRISPENAREIIKAISPFVKTVGVFVDESPDRVREILEFCGLDLIQFHGEEPPEICAAFMPRSVKAFRVRDGSVLSLMRQYQGRIRAMLLDAFSSERHGGTGESFDWDIALMARGLGIPLILSGGLNPANIRDAISAVRPFAVDVSSGIEARPGKKDPLLMEAFMTEIRRSEGTWIWRLSNIFEKS
jgi:phosphoribosylanthranilate isomerase